MSQALALYARTGRIDMSPQDRTIPPVVFDSEAMQKILDELILEENAEQLEAQMPDVSLPLG